MREILFRGKCTDLELYGCKGWTEGSYIQHGDGSCDIMGIFEDILGNVEELHFPVDPETIGQYTGLTDKNGKKIFEGDILRRNGKDIFVVEWAALFARFEMRLIGSDAYYNLTAARGECEVVGNIYDNPELLEDERHVN